MGSLLNTAAAKSLCIIRGFASYSLWTHTQTHMGRYFPLCRSVPFSCYSACSEVMEGWKDGCLSVCTCGWGSVCAWVCFHLHMLVRICVRALMSECACSCIHVCVCIHVGGEGYLFWLFSMRVQCVESITIPSIYSSSSNMDVIYMVM